MQVSRKHLLSGEVNTLDLDITEEQLKRLEMAHNGITNERVQNIVPHLSPDEREFLINGLLPGQFDEIVGPEEDEENDEQDDYPDAGEYDDNDDEQPAY